MTNGYIYKKAHIILYLSAEFKDYAVNDVLVEEITGWFKDTQLSCFKFNDFIKLDYMIKLINETMKKADNYCPDELGSDDDIEDFGRASGYSILAYSLSKYILNYDTIEWEKGEEKILKTMYNAASTVHYCGRYDEATNMYKYLEDALVNISKRIIISSISKYELLKIFEPMNMLKRCVERRNRIDKCNNGNLSKACEDVVMTEKSVLEEANGEFAEYYFLLRKIYAELSPDEIYTKVTDYIEGKFDI